MNDLTKPPASDGLPRRLRYHTLTTWWHAASLLRPWRPVALFHLGNARYAHGRRADAIRAWQAAVVVDTTHVKALHNLANALFETRQWADAAVAYERLAASRHDTASVFLAGKCRFTLHQRDAAAAQFRRCIEIDPQHVGALEHLGRLALARRDGPNAIAWLTRALAGADQKEALHFLLGAACEVARQPDAALAHYREVRSDTLRAQASLRIARLETPSQRRTGDTHGH